LVVLVFGTVTAFSSLAQDFGNPEIIDSGQVYLSAVFPADLDGDGDVDVLSATRINDRIAWYENVGMGNGIGGGAFSAYKFISSAANSPTSLFAADLDGDGDADVLSASTDGKIAWYENNGWAGFGSIQVITSKAPGAVSVHAIDLDGDGDSDVLSASQTDNMIAWYENLGGGAFGSLQVITVTAVAANTVYAADLDGDGDADVLSASNGDDKIAWYENQGSGSFGPPRVITLDADSAMSVYAADLDGDGDADVVSASFFDYKIAWYENLGGGSFGSQRILTTQAKGAAAVHAEDLDGDGDMDVLSASCLDDKLAWYENLGAGSFGPQQVISNRQWDCPDSVYATDLTGNGMPDLLVALGGIGDIVWYPTLMRDCNGNGVLDPIDIANGTSQDCDANGIPDECDLTDDPSSDWNGDGFIDECFGPYYCEANINSTGQIAYMALSGTPVMADNNFRLIARDLPNQEFGYFLTSASPGFIPNFGGSSGNLCLGAPVRRFVKPPKGRILNSGSNGQFRLKVDLTNLPNGVVFMPGQTWYFQAWYRDGITSNTSRPTAVMWR